MLANRVLKSVPGTRCGASPDASKQGAQIGARHPVRDLPKWVPGTRCDASPDASKQGAQIGARHPVRRQSGC